MDPFLGLPVISDNPNGLIEAHEPIHGPKRKSALERFIQKLWVGSIKKTVHNKVIRFGRVSPLFLVGIYMSDRSSIKSSMLF